MSLKHQQDGSAALYKLSNKAAALSPMDAAPPSPTPQVGEGVVSIRFTPSVRDLLSFRTGKLCWPQVSLIGRKDNRDP
jgi:hypothetical protein